MIIGLLSDTHGHLARCKTACKHLLKADSEAIIHCGDIGSENVAIELAAIFDAFALQVYAVLGNVDLHDDELIHFPTTTCVHISRIQDLTLDQKRIAVIHGDDSHALDEAISSQQYDYLFTGHTHTRDDRTIGKTRIINPGAVYRATEPGCAALNTSTGELKYLNL